jgi:uncharacterized protein YbjT (DUF2867 family)
MRILVTGATGYIGGRLVPRLLELGHSVRVLVRDAGRIRGRPWAETVEVCTGDLLKAEDAAHACHGIDAAYYLVHSMYGEGDFAEKDASAARNFAASAKNVPLTIYLGGLLPQASEISAHLKSRAEVGAILRATVPTTEFRAGPIIGSGSASFEMVRYLTDRLPAMITPRWIKNEVQPIAIRDILSYLIAALEKPALGVVEIGSDRLTFMQMMKVYADVRGYSRWIFPLPVLAPRLAALWVGFITPIPNRLAVPLVQGVVHPLVADTGRALAIFPEIHPIPYREAVERALAKIKTGDVETRWSGALGEGKTYQLVDWEGTIREQHSLRIEATPRAVFRAFTALGGERGWLVWNWAWWVRGLLDKALGGPGLRRGRRHPQELLPGEALDFWRVEAVEPDALLRLRAEMKLPGRAWLQFEAVSENGGTRLVQTAIFLPNGFAGALYWYAIYPIHKWIFSDLIRAIARAARQEDNHG